MECYLVNHTNGPLNDLLRKTLKNRSALPAHTMDKLNKKYNLPFWFDLVKTLHDVNQKCTLPLVYWGLLIEYRGLSRIGRELQHSVGLGLDQRTYGRTKARLLQDYTRGVQTIVNNRECVITFDNYNHIWRKLDLRQNRTGAYATANFTVCGVSQLPPGHNVPLLLEEYWDDTQLTLLVSSQIHLQSFSGTV